MDPALAALRRRPAEPSVEAAPAPRRIDGWAVGLVAALVGAAALGSVAASGAMRRAGEPVEGEAAVLIGDRTVQLPRAWLREPGGDGLQLRIPLSAFAGAGAPPDGAVLVRIGPRDGAMAPSERPVALYARFLLPMASSGEGGLIRRDFKPGSPFEGETLHLAPPDGRAFAARCPQARTGTVRETCLAEIRAGGSDIQVRLAPEHLAHWSAVTRGLERLAGR